MPKKLFCEYGAAAYWLSVKKNRLLRHVKNITSSVKFARSKNTTPLPHLVKEYATILHRDSPLFDQVSERNKVHNVQLALPNFTHMIIRPGEVLSFWLKAGNPTKHKGYKPARVLKNNKPAMSEGGGLCQISNMINYLALHSDLTRTEYHDHDWADLYPEFGTGFPFGTSTSTFYNYRDLRFKNDTDLTYQFIFYIKDNHLHGQLLSDKQQRNIWELSTPESFFTKEPDGVYRNGRIVRKLANSKYEEEIKRYHAKLLYDAMHVKENIHEPKAGN